MRGRPLNYYCVYSAKFKVVGVYRGQTMDGNSLLALSELLKPSEEEGESDNVSCWVFLNLFYTNHSISYSNLRKFSTSHVHVHSHSVVSEGHALVYVVVEYSYVSEFPHTQIMSRKMCFKTNCEEDHLGKWLMSWCPGQDLAGFVLKWRNCKCLLKSSWRICSSTVKPFAITGNNLFEIDFRTTDIMCSGLFGIYKLCTHSIKIVLLLYSI